MKSLIQLLSLVCVLVFFTSCYPSQVATTSGAMVEPDILYSNSWDLAELNGVAITGDDQISYIKFTPTTNRITGYTGCNYIGGSIALADKNGITFSPVATTKHTCAGNTLDVSLLPALRNVDR